VSIPTSAEIIVPAADPTNSTGHPLRCTEARENFDGTKARFVTFESGHRIFRYTPPAGWQLKAVGEQSVLAKGKCTAALALIEMNDTIQRQAREPTIEEIRHFQLETIAKVPARDRGEIEPVVFSSRIANQPVLQITVSYVFSGQTYVLQRVRSWGENWRLEGENTGPKEEFEKVDAEITQSLFSIELRTEQERRTEAAQKEQAALEKMAAEEKSIPPQTSGKIRGRLP
jgi:hypothetical protein